MEEFIIPGNYGIAFTLHSQYDINAVDIHEGTSNRTKVTMTGETVDMLIDWLIDHRNAYQQS